jgi:outer membrane protein
MLALALAAPGSAETLNQAFARAYQTNPEIQAARSALEAADYQIQVARAGSHPSVFLDGSAGRVRWGLTSTLFHLVGASLATNEYEYGLGVAQPIWQGGRVTSEIRTAQNQVSERLARLHEIEQRVFLAVVSAYTSVYLDQQVLRLEEHNERLLFQHLQSTKARLRNGEATRTDLAEAQARLEQAKSELIAARGQLANENARFVEVVGSKPGFLAAPTATHSLPRSLAETEALASENFSVIAARFGVREANETIATVRSASLPDIQLLGTYERTYNPEFGFTRLNTASILLSVSVPIYSGGVTRSRIRQARAELRENRENARAVLREALAEATQSWQRYVTAGARLRALHSQVTAEKIAYRGVVAEHRQGVKTLLNVLNAEQELLVSQVAYVSARAERMVAGYAIRAAVGTLTYRHILHPDRSGRPRKQPAHSREGRPLLSGRAPRRYAREFRLASRRRSSR